MLSGFVPVAASSPVEHVLPHRLHDAPLFTLEVGEPDLNVPFLGIYDGVYSFYITNHMMMTLVAAVLVVLVFAWVASRVRPVGEGITAFQTKGRLAQMFETMCVFVRDEIARPNLGGVTDKYIHYIWTIFFFILFANVLGLVPLGYLLQLLTGDVHGEGHLKHWGGTATSNLALNGVLAICSFIAIIYIGIREVGAKGFFGHFNPVGWEPAMLPIGLMLYVLEWMGLIIKCIVLAMRLFGTMMAGHLVIAAFVMLIFSAAAAGPLLGYGVGLAVVLGGTALTLLELFICLLQAFIFTFLTVLFIASAGVHHEDEHHVGEEAGEDTDMVHAVRPAELSATT